MIEFFYEDTEILDIDPEFLVSWLSNVCEQEDKELAEVSIIYCSDAYLLEMNKKYLNHDYYTDIITFDYCEHNLILGDLFISVDTVRDNAVTHETSFLNELNRVMVHGVLHLCGYKDKSDADALLMRTKEDFYLNQIVSRGTI